MTCVVALCAPVHITLLCELAREGIIRSKVADSSHDFRRYMVNVITKQAGESKICHLRDSNSEQEHSDVKDRLCVTCAR